MVLDKWLTQNLYSRKLLFFLGYLYIFLVGFVDYITPVEIRLTILYLPSIFLFSWYLGRFHAVIASLISSGLWFFGESLSEYNFSFPFIIYWNLAGVVSIFLLFSFVVSSLRLILKVKMDQLEALKKANGDIQRLSAVKTQFINTVSHELRTPLTIVKESVGIVYDGEAGAINSEQKEFLITAKKNVDRLTRLITDVLDFQQLEEKKMTFHMAKSDLYHILHEAAENFAQIAKNKGLEISVEPEKGLPYVLLDPDKILQVLTNFIGNAIKFTEKGRITLKTTRLENAVQVSVQDHGIGIKEEDFPKLFKPFGQLASARERKTGTTGLGLSISKEIIEAHNGKIGVESVYGEGATFYFTLPVQHGEFF